AALAQNALDGADLESGIEIVGIGGVTEQIELFIEDGMPGKVNEQQIRWLALVSELLEARQALITALSDHRFDSCELTIRPLERLGQACDIGFGIPQTHLVRAIGTEQVSVAILAHGWFLAGS